MGMTLLEAVKLMINRGEVRRSAVVETFASSSDILAAIPFNDIQGNAYAYNQEQTLPGIGFRGINGSYIASVGVINPEVEPLIIAGGDIDVDPFIIQTGGNGVRQTHQIMKIKALSHAWTKTFLKGSTATDVKSFDGLQNRLTGDQLIDAGATASGDALSLAILDQLIDSVDNPTHLIMNKALRRRLSTAARTTTVGGNILWQPDAFGRQMMYYNDLPILIADKDETGTDILPFTEAAASGSSLCSSIYCVSMGDGMLQGIQNGGIQVRDIGEQGDTVVRKTRIEWYCGIALEHPRCAARIRYIKNAAFTA